ncbi:MAG TPA: multiheme c-type cytochrome [Anaeromyxobacteraceae bacterium]|nr:multiheme c-type cytochrome [Anaeromyxobacteraceae bacterium]
MTFRAVLATLLACAATAAWAAADASAGCVECHQKRTPTIVSDWKLSKHSEMGIGCDSCHGTGHASATDVAKVKIPTPDTCAQCHETQVKQFKGSKHAFAWAAMKAMPTFHYQPMALMEGQKGCGGCHKLGLKSEQEVKDIKKAGGAANAFGLASCDACHTRHTFSKKEAQQPQACQTCHMGFDHPQWEMYSASKHGVRQDLKSRGVLPKDAGAPTCQTCHMQHGDHGVTTGWGFLAVRLPMPEDKQWAADRATILQGLGVLDPDGKPTARLEVVKAAQVARLDAKSFDDQRAKMLATCNQCHSGNFARSELEKGDQLIKEADHLMAEGIRTVAALYKDGVLPKPKDYAYAFPDLLTFHDAPTVVEQKLFVMFLEHRMRTFQGSFHNNPDYALWYGWSEMVRDLAEIKAGAAELREKAKRK